MSSCRTLPISFDLSPSLFPNFTEPHIREPRVVFADDKGFYKKRLLSDVKIVDTESLKAAIQALHDKYRVPHIIITSVSFSQTGKQLSVIGSSMTAAGKARLFRIVFPSIDCYFCGTGDMFGALVTARMREAVRDDDADGAGNLLRVASWLSPDSVTVASELPLAKAAEKVLGSMHHVLTRTQQGIQGIVDKTRAGLTEDERTSGKAEQHIKSKAAELRLVQHLDALQNPEVLFKAQSI